MHVRFKKTMMLIVWSSIFKLCVFMIIFKFRQKPVFSEKTGFLLIIGLKHGNKFRQTFIIKQYKPNRI